METKNEEAMVMRIERFYIKSRGLRMEGAEAMALGIKRVYNQTSDIDYMNVDQIGIWVDGLVNRDAGEACLVESAFKYVEGVPLYVTTCIVFVSTEFCNLFYMKHQGLYKETLGFSSLLN
jgi:hypothetical protein